MKPKRRGSITSAETPKYGADKVQKTLKNIEKIPEKKTCSHDILI